MDYQVLKAISLHVSRENGWDMEINKNKHLGMMIFCTRGPIYVDGVDKCIDNGGCLFGEELLDWVLDSSFPALLPISTFRVVFTSSSEVSVLRAKDLARLVSEYKSNFSRVITPKATDLYAVNTLYWLKKVRILRNMDDQVVLEIVKHLKCVTYSGSNVVITKMHEPLEMMFVMLYGGTAGYVDVARDDGRLGSSHGYGYYQGSELLHWIINWEAHGEFPPKLPLSSRAALVNPDQTNRDTEVAFIMADDLKRIVSEFRLQFMKQTTLPVDSEGKLAAFDPLAMLKKVPILENMDKEVLKGICAHLNPMKYSNDPPEGRFIFKEYEKIYKMFFIIRGLVSFVDTVSVGPHHIKYIYSGNYFGEELLQWAFDSSTDKVPVMDDGRVYVCVGEVEVLVLMAEDLATVISRSKDQPVTQVSQTQIPSSKGLFSRIFRF